MGQLGIVVLVSGARNGVYAASLVRPRYPTEYTVMMDLPSDINYFAPRSYLSDLPKRGMCWACSSYYTCLQA